MQKENLNKEALISLWNRACKESEDKDAFSMAGSDESPYYLLTIDKDTSPSIISTISATPKGNNNQYDYKINIIFGEFVEYTSFNLDKSEFDSLADLFMTHKNYAINEEVNRIVKDTEERFLNLVSDGKV